MKESQIEKHLTKLVKAHGGLSYKFISPNNPGVPDRIVVTPNGKTIYVELKTEVGRLADMQKWQIDRLRKNGADVRVLKGLQQVKDFVKEVFTDAISTA